MADVEANIVLTTVGGDAAASEVSKATTALNSMTSASSGMEAQFQHRFQHIGLMLFAGDALRASGLGRETRAVILAMNTALTGLQEAAGISSGGILLVVTALAALAAIAVKVIDHHKNESEALQKLADQQDKSYEGYQKEIGAIQDIAENADSKLSPALAAWLAADKQVAEDMKNNLLATQEKEIVALEKQRDALQTTADMHAALKKAVDTVKDAFQQLLAPFKAAADTMTGWAHTIAGLIPVTTQHVALTGDLKQKYDELSASIAKVRGQHDLLAHEGTTDVQAVAQATIKARQEEEKAWEDMAGKISAGEKLQAEMQMKLHKQIAEDRKKQTDLEASYVKAGADRMGTDMGNAFAKMIVEGKSFTQEMMQAFTNMAEQIISWIIKMIAEWAIFSALTGMGYGGAAASAFPAFAGKQASGGSVMADTPTLALFGEAGPEVATFSPVGVGAQGGGGGTVVNATVNVTANGVSDPQQLARMIGPALIQEIRGQGQLNFTRA